MEGPRMQKCHKEARSKRSTETFHNEAVKQKMRLEIVKYITGCQEIVEELNTTQAKKKETTHSWSATDEGAQDTHGSFTITARKRRNV
jgi:hypothetical protein